MSVLLIADINGNDSSVDQTSKALSAAKELGSVTILSFGSGIEELNNNLKKLEPIDKVLTVEKDSFSNGKAEPIANLISELSKDFSYIVASSTAFGKNILPRVAAMLDVMMVSDIIEVIDKDTFKRPIYAGNAIQTVKSNDKIKVLSIRTASFETSSENGNAELVKLDKDSENNLSKWIEDKVDTSDRPELTSAKVVVSGGRGVGSEENFKIIEKLAGKLGAAVGASRAAVDSGFAPNDWQVGQTGKVVAPDLYVAIGISGAIQHLAGMKDSKVIVAINKDEEAPIFQIADYGVVADLFEAVPELESKI